MSSTSKVPKTSTADRFPSKRTLFLLCDVQEKCRSVVPHFDALVVNTQKLIKAGQILDVPLIVTEQFPERFGGTVKELNIDHRKARYTKLQFSMITPDVRTKIHKLFRGENKLRSVVLFGIETHVCVEQTAMDLREHDIDVHVVVDCCLSRSADERQFAFERMQQMGCSLTTSENVIFNLLRTADHPRFNDVRKLVAKSAADTGLSKL